MGLTPNLDRMGRLHTHVANSFTCQPVCGPARACLQTGLYATNVGCFRNGIPLPEGSQTLAHSFRQAGYQTGYIGKWHLHEGHGAVPAGARFGYDSWLASNVRISVKVATRFGVMVAGNRSAATRGVEVWDSGHHGSSREGFGQGSTSFGWGLGVPEWPRSRGMMAARIMLWGTPSCASTRR
jgi:arylsulfatase A-like enzyme